MRLFLSGLKFEHKNFALSKVFANKKIETNYYRYNTYYVCIHNLLLCKVYPAEKLVVKSMLVMLITEF